MLPLQWTQLTKTVHTARMGREFVFVFFRLSLCWCMFCFTLDSWVTSASEMTYIVSSGALNSTHSLTHSKARKVTAGLSHWSCVTDFFGTSTYGLKDLWKGRSYVACVPSFSKYSCLISYHYWMTCVSIQHSVVLSFELSVVSSRAFPVTATKIWNALPDNFASASLDDSFRCQLTTFCSSDLTIVSALVDFAAVLIT